MKKFLILIALLCGLYSQITFAQEKPVIKIGVICPLSGNVASNGEEMRAALAVAMEDLKNTKYKYELIFEDDQMIAAKSAAATQKLIKADKVDALITFGSGPGNVISPIAQAARVPHMTICSDRNVAKGEYNFNHWTPPEKEAPLFVAELVKRKIHSVAIIMLNHQGYLYNLECALPLLEKAGIKVTSQQRFNAGERDFRMYIAKAMEQKPEALFTGGFSPESELLQKQINESHLSIPTVSIIGADLAEDLRPFEGLWYVSGAASPEWLEKRVKQKIPIKKLYFTGFAYDMLHLFAQAFEKLGASGQKPTGKQVVEDLAKLDGYKSVLGPISVDSEGVFQTEASVKMVQNGEVRVIKP